MANENLTHPGDGQAQGGTPKVPDGTAPPPHGDDSQRALDVAERKAAELRASNLRATREVTTELFPVSAPDIEDGSIPHEYDAVGFIEQLRGLGRGKVDRIRGRLALKNYSSARRLL